MDEAIKALQEENARLRQALKDAEADRLKLWDLFQEVFEGRDWERNRADRAEAELTCVRLRLIRTEQGSRDGRHG